MSDIATKLTTIAENQQKVYDAGHTKGTEEGHEAGLTEGYDNGYSVGVTDGREAEWSDFWDSYQTFNGTTALRAYQYYSWNIDLFRPKYNLSTTTSPSSIAYAFYGVYSQKAADAGDFIGRFDFAEKLKECGVTLDTGNASIFTYCFADSGITHLPKIDLSNATTTTAMCANSPIATIDEVVCTAKTKFASTFATTALRNIKFTGEIAQKGLILPSTRLSRDSIESVIAALSSTTSGLSVTLSKTAVETAFGSTTADEWTTLIATKPNWTISLV